MDILITHGGLARSRSLHLRTSQIVVVVSLVVLLLMSLSGLIYHFVFLKAARDGWPVVGQVSHMQARPCLILCQCARRLCIFRVSLITKGGSLRPHPPARCYCY